MARLEPLPAHCLAILWMLALLLFAAPSNAADLALRGEWLKGSDAVTPAALRSGEMNGQFETFEPTLRRSFPRNPDGVWIRLTPQGGSWPDGDLALLVREAGLEKITLYYADRAPLTRHPLLPAPADIEPGYGRLHFPLQDPAGPLLLKIEPQSNLPSSIRFAVAPHRDFVYENAHWLAFASACFAIMLAMAVVALFFSLILRDTTFLIYAGYVICFSGVLLLQSGYVVHPLGWRDALTDYLPFGRAAAALSIFLAALFLDRFAHLPRYAPRARLWVLGLGYSVLALVLLGALPHEALHRLPSLLINPLILLGTLLMLLVASIAAWRGSRYALVFLLGWTPLLVITMLGSVKLPALASAGWLGHGMLAAGAFEALVLSLGLAGRAHALRNERDSARALAETDPLTGLLNRRAWDTRLGSLVVEARTADLPLSVVFFDLDRFKGLNDTFGHEAGDRALQAMARIVGSRSGPRGLAGRYGGEEFVVALPGSDAASALQVAGHMREELHALAIAADSEHRPLGVSLGVAELTRGDDAASLVSRADRAMYDEKQRRHRERS